MLVHVKKFDVEGYTTIEDLILNKSKELRPINKNSYKDLYHQEHYRYRKVSFIAESKEDNTIITDGGKIVCLYEHKGIDYYSVYDLFSETKPNDSFDGFNQERVHLVKQIKEWRTPKKVFLAQVDIDGNILFNPHIVYKDENKTVFTSDMDYTGHSNISLDTDTEGESYGLYELSNNDFSNFDWSKIVLNQKKYIRIHLPEIEAENLSVEDLSNLNNIILEEKDGNDLYLSFKRHTDELLSEKLTFSLKINGNKPENVTIFIY